MSKMRLYCNSALGSAANAAHQQRARVQLIKQILMAARLMDELVSCSLFTLNQACQSILYHCTERKTSLLVGGLGLTSGVGALDP
jgi:hypothetical protein